MKPTLIVCLALLLAAEPEGGVPPQLGVGTARVFVPAVLRFEVPDVSVEAVSSTPLTVSFDSAILVAQALRISVRADGDLTIPGGAAIPVSNVSWTVSTASGGVAFNGTLSKVVYTTVYQSNVGAPSGSVQLTWKLAPPEPGIRAGTREAALRWRFEAVTP